MTELELVTCMGCGGGGVVIDVGVVPNCVYECQSCRGTGRAPKVVTLTVSADPKPYEPPRVFDLGTVEDVVKENLELKRLKEALSVELEHVRETLAPFCENASAPAMASEIAERLKGRVPPADSWAGRTIAKYPNKTLREIIEELEDRITGLQTDNTRLVEQRRAVDERYMVEHFHRVCDIPVLREPQVPADERVRLRLRLIAEEFFELLESTLPNETLIPHCRDRVMMVIRAEDVEVDLPEFADACADLKYVIVGAELEFGIDGRPVFLGVHEANLKKVGGPRRADGKVQKPEGWKAFDVSAELKRQGWRGR